jgi:O-antigen/teichoic acid export membrane protein
MVNRTTPVAEKSRAANDFASRMLVLLLLGAMPVVLFPGILLRMLFSPAFISAAAVLWLFVLWQCVFQLVYVYQQLLVGLDDVVFAAGISVVGFATAIVLAAPLVGRFGLRGVALALAGGMVFTGTGILARLSRRHQCRMSSRVMLRFAGVIGAVVAAGLLFAGRPEYGVGVLWPRLCYAVVLLVLTWTALDREERDPRLWLAAMRQNRDEIKGS